MKKKLFAILCAVIMMFSVAAFAACGDKPPEIKDPPGGNTENGGTGGGNNEGDDSNLVKEPLASIKIVTGDGADILSKEYVDCTVAAENGRDSENFAPVAAEVRVRGNNTAEYDKKPFRIKFNKKRSMLGLNDGAECKSWVLLASWKDTSMLRDVAAYDMGRKILGGRGLYCTDTRFVEVYVNDDYRGLYLLAEQQQVNKNRVSVYEPEEGYTGTDIGYFFEYDGYYRMENPDECFTLNYIGKPITCQDGSIKALSSMVGYVVKNDMYTTAQRDFIAAYTQNIYDILYAAVYKDEYLTFNADYTVVVPGNFVDSKAAVEAVIDLDSYIDMYILQDVCCDNDLDWSSFFMSADMSASGNKKLTFQAPWDFDSAFGLMKTSIELDVQQKIFAANAYTIMSKQLKNIVNPWTTILAQADWFWPAVNARWRELSDAGVFSGTLTMIDEYTEKYRDAFARNFER